MLGRTTNTTSKPTGTTGTGVGSTTGSSSTTTTGGFQRNAVSKLTTGFNSASSNFNRAAPSSNSPSSPSPINSFRSGSFGSSSSSSAGTGSPTSAMAQARAALLQKSQQGAAASGGVSPVSSNASPQHSPTPDRVTPTSQRFNLRDTSSVQNTNGSHSTTTTPSYVRPSATKEGGGGGGFAVSNSPFATRNQIQTHTLRQTSGHPSSTTTSPTRSRFSRPGSISSAAGVAAASPTAAAATVTLKPIPAATSATSATIPRAAPAPAPEPVVVPTAVIVPVVADQVIPSPACEPAASPKPELKAESVRTIEEPVDPVPSRTTEKEVIVAEENKIIVEAKMEGSAQIDVPVQELPVPAASLRGEEAKVETSAEINTVEALVSADAIEEMGVEMERGDEVLEDTTSTIITDPVEGIVSAVDISIEVVKKEEEKATVPSADTRQEEVVEAESVIPAAFEEKVVYEVTDLEEKDAKEEFPATVEGEKVVATCIHKTEVHASVSNVEQDDIKAQEDASSQVQAEEEESIVKEIAISSQCEESAVEDTTEAQEKEYILTQETVHAPEADEKEEERAKMEVAQDESLPIVEERSAPEEETILAEESEKMEVEIAAEEQEIATVAAEEPKEEQVLEQEHPQEQEENAPEQQIPPPPSFDEMHQNPPSPARMTREAATAAYEAAVEFPVVSKTKEEMLQSAPEQPIMVSPSVSTRSSISSSFSSFSVNGLTQPSTPTEESQNGRKAGFISQKFHWKHGGETVKVTGTFDNWQETVHLKKVPGTRDEFAAIVDLDRTAHIQFKFVVDGVWRCSTEFATEYDYSGHLNNVLHAIPLERQQLMRQQHHHHRQY